jgi:anti-anti-sigma factor
MKSGDVGCAIDYRLRRITLRGDIDVAAAPAVIEALTVLHNHTAGDITIRMDDVTFIDAAGLGAIASARSHLTVTGADPQTRRIFTLGRLGDLLQPATPAAPADLPPARAATYRTTAAAGPASTEPVDDDATEVMRSWVGHYLSQLRDRDRDAYVRLLDQSQRDLDN